ALDAQHVGGARAPLGRVHDRVDHDRPALEPRGDRRRERRAQPDGADDVERGRIGGSGAQAGGVLGCTIDAGLDRLHHGDAALLGTERVRERAADEGLPDAGVGPRDEERAHVAVASRIESATTSISRSRSATSIASGGMSTMTLPSGRMTTPRARAARTTRWPTRAA